MLLNLFFKIVWHKYKKGKKITAIAMIYQENLVKWQHIMKEGKVRACESSDWLGLLCIVNIYIKIKHNRITDWRHDVKWYPCKYITLKSCKWNMYTSIFNSNQIYTVKCIHIYINGLYCKTILAVNCFG